MKKRIMALVLVSVLVLSAAFTGCSSQTEEENPQNSSQSSQAEEPESSSEAEEPASEDGSSEDDAASAGDLPSASEPVAEGIAGAVVMNDGSIFGTGTEVLGTEADLEAWNQAIAGRDSIARVLVSTMNTERDLTEEEVNTVLDTLEGLSPAVMAELGNPATGGATNVAAFDQSGIRPVTSAEAEPVQVNVTARNAIAAEMVVVSDGQKAAEFAAELQSVVPSDQAIPSDVQPVEILLVYSMDGGEHRYQLYRESDADYIAKDGVLYQCGAGLSTWADAVIPALPAVPEGADAAQTSGTEEIVLKKSSLYRAGERVVWDTALQEQIRGWIADARPLEGEFTPDTGGETIEVSFGEGNSYIFSSQTQDGAGLMKHDSAWYLVEKEAFSTLSGVFS